MLSFEQKWAAHYPEGLDRHLEYPDLPVHGLLEGAAREFPDTPATIFMGAALTYAQILDKTYRFAAALAALGLDKGDRVGLMLPNCPQMVIAYYGVLKAGGVVVALNPLYVEREIRRQVADSGAKMIVALDLMYDRVAAVRDAVALEARIWTSVKDFLPFPLNLLYPIKARKAGHRVGVPSEPGSHQFLDLLSGHEPAPPSHDFDPAVDLCCLQYTGGTTGTSKGCMLTHGNMVANAIQVSRWTPEVRRGKEKILAVLPLFHSYGMTCCLNVGAAVGATLILIPRFIVEDILRAINRHRPSLFPGTPTMYIAINNHPSAGRYNLRSIRACVSGSAPLPLEVQKKFEETTGGHLVEGYGLSEASPVTHANPLFGLRKPGSVGIPYPDTVSRIVDLETGLREVSLGETGELIIKGPQVMPGYWNRPEETAWTIRDGWLYTGDIARMDEDGFTYIVDRKKEMIIAGGFNIYPREVEEVLYEHPAVLEAAVIGVPDAYRGETVKAFVVVKEGEHLTGEELIEFCRDKLARFKVPRIVEFRSELPRSFVGKVLRRVLAEEEEKRRAGP